MDAFEMSLFARIMAAQARIAAMQAGNEAAKMSHAALMPYGESDFMDVAHEIDHLADALRDRG